MHPCVEGVRGGDVVDESAGVAREAPGVGAHGCARVVEGDLDVEARRRGGDAAGERGQLGGGGGTAPQRGRREHRRGRPGGDERGRRRRRRSGRARSRGPRARARPTAPEGSRSSPTQRRSRGTRRARRSSPPRGGRRRDGRCRRPRSGRARGGRAAPRRVPLERPADLGEDPVLRPARVDADDAAVAERVEEEQRELQIVVGQDVAAVDHGALDLSIQRRDDGRQADRSGDDGDDRGAHGAARSGDGHGLARRARGGGDAGGHSSDGRCAQRMANRGLTGVRRFDGVGCARGPAGLRAPDRKDTG